MEDTAYMHVHPKDRGRSVICGKKLGVGDKLGENDLYASMTGEWEECPCPGVILGETEVIWIRPV